MVKNQTRSDFVQLVRETFLPYIPTPNFKRAEFLDKVRQKVRFYQPKIEERCKIKLGDIAVKDNCDWLSDIVYESSSKKAAEMAWATGRIPTEKDFKLELLNSALAEAIVTIPLWFYNNFVGAEMRHHKNTLYVPFGVINRFLDVDFVQRTQKIDYAVVHELSHSLWDRIAGDDADRKPLDGSRDWFEGFATYCSDNYFADFYPPGTKKLSNLKGPYVQGKKKVEYVVRENGQEVILKIPAMWEEFAKNKLS